MTIQQLIPAPGWCALFARRLDTGELHLWMEPLIAWALVQEDFAEAKTKPSSNPWLVWGPTGFRGLCPAHRWQDSCSPMCGTMRTSNPTAPWQRP